MRRIQLPFLLALLLLAGVGLAFVAVSWLGWHGDVRYADVPTVTRQLAQGAATSPPEPAQPPPADERDGIAATKVQEDAPPPAAAEVAPTAADRASVPDGSPIGLVGQLAPPTGDAALPGSRPSIAILVTGLGLAKALSEAALKLQPAVALAVSPYADDAAGWLTRVRTANHEALLMLPVEPMDPQLVDPGPRAIGADQPIEARDANLAWLVGRGDGYLGFAAEAGAFGARPESFAAVAEFLARRKAGFVELGTARLAAIAKAGNLVYLASEPALDEQPRSASIDEALGRLEARAMKEGSAVGWARGYPVTFARLAVWSDTLSGKGLRLATLSALLAAASPPTRP